jgi:hypothetical protein
MKRTHHLPEEDTGFMEFISFLVEKLGTKIARGMTKGFWHHRFEIESVMRETVVAVCEAKADLSLDQESLDYVARAIKYRIMDYINSIPMVHASGRTTRRLIDGKTVEEIAERRFTFTCEIPERAVMPAFDSDDFLLSLARDEQEKFIVSCRLNGDNNRIIAEKIGVSERHVGRIIESLKRRLWE